MNLKGNFQDGLKRIERCTVSCRSCLYVVVVGKIVAVGVATCCSYATNATKTYVEVASQISSTVNKV